MGTARKAAKNIASTVNISLISLFFFCMTLLLYDTWTCS